AAVLSPGAAAASDGTLVANHASSWQTNGVVATVAYGNGVVYLGGSFTAVRPPGAAPGTGEVARSYLAAFDASSGELLDFNHRLDRRVTGLYVSPEGSRLYVGGDFLSVDGVFRRKAAVFSTATGELTSWKVGFNGPVRAFHQIGSTVYAGGGFSTVKGVARTGVAAISTAGELQAWAPQLNGRVRAITSVPDGSRVVIGGPFSTVNGQARQSIASLDASTAQLRPWAATHPSCSFVTSLTRVGDTIYGSAAGKGSGCYEGTFAADPMTGVERWRETCRGATEAVAVVGSYLYKGSHAHDCSTAGGFPENYDNRDTYNLLSVSLSNGGLGDWLPGMQGKGVGPLAMATDGKQLFVGGTFSGINGQGQQGFARFEAGPDLTLPGRPVAPKVSSVKTGTVSVRWTAVTDRDDGTLTYRLFRDGGRTPIHEQPADSRPWDRPVLQFEDTDLAPGSTHTYQVQVVAPDNAGPKSGVATVTVTGTDKGYAPRVLADVPLLYWPLDEASGSTAVDAAGDNDGTLSSGATRASEGALGEAGDRAVQLDGRSGRVLSPQLFNNPRRYSVEAWFKTDTRAGGKLIGFGSSTSTSGSYDRHVYMTNSGQLVFGTHPGRPSTISTSAAYNDNRWHHLVATQGTNGMRLYVNGVLRASNTTVDSENYLGYWRIGGDNLNGWPSAPSSYYVRAAMDEFAVFGYALTAEQVTRHFNGS
ncbi:MAG: hypothetical protein M3493_08495, partial [Actinomycetota bacterium]|nr:hypothetical protein [Actinomycetota bacterium]